MSIQSDRNRLVSLQRDLAQIQSQISGEREKIQRKGAEIGSIDRSVSSSTSISSLQSKSRQIEQKQRDIVGYEKKLASLVKRLSDKNAELTRVRSSLDKKEEQARRKAINEEKKRQATAARETKKLSAELAKQSRLHRELSQNPIVVKYEELPEKIVVLFIASNPQDQNQLRLDEEIRLIEQKIRASKYRDAVDLKAIWATRPGDLLQAINEHRPTVVHFSGHGSSNDELILQDDAGKTKEVGKAALVEMFKISSSGIELVVFNTCFSTNQAKDIVLHVPATIGMGDSIGDDAARVFAAQLYSAIGFGKNLLEAFGQAKSALMLEGLPEEKTPELHFSDGVSGDQLVLVRP